MHAEHGILQVVDLYVQVIEFASSISEINTDIIRMKVIISFFIWSFIFLSLSTGYNNISDLHYNIIF